MWVIAISNDLLVARAAYDAAVRYNPRERWLLRDGIRVVSVTSRQCCFPNRTDRRKNDRLCIIGRDA
jgi:hypothetical protein